MARFVQNRWYQFAWTDEIADGAVLTRTVLDIPMVAFRTDAGKMAVLDNRCPHRFAPLSEGKREGDTIACPYHGLVFNTAGQCVRNPHGAATSTLAVASFPVLERHKAVWIWVGQQEPDENLLPDLSFIDAAAETAQLRLHTAVQANYELLADNILDLSHADYLHASSLGSGFNTRAKSTVEEHADHFSIAWRSDSDDAPPAFNLESPAKLWTEVDWYAPALMVLRAGGHPVGKPERGIDTLNLHNMTPETLTSTHYFSCNTRNFLIDDAAFNAVMREQLIHAFQVEDKPMIEKVQRQMGTPDLWSLGPKMLPIDKGAVLARRRVAKLIEAAE
ncbi:UNVERIFIED_ORG: vanillate O-demethylase monooxygenase subunit [Sphingomonas sp. R1F5B]